MPDGIATNMFPRLSLAQNDILFAAAYAILLQTCFTDVHRGDELTYVSVNDHIPRKRMQSKK